MIKRPANERFEYAPPGGSLVDQDRSIAETRYIRDAGVGIEQIVVEGIGKGVERHGGAITARSNPGEGSTFIAALPPARPRKYYSTGIE